MTVLDTFIPPRASAPPYGLAFVAPYPTSPTLASEIGGISPDAKGRLLSRVLLVLLTRRGSSRVRPEFGTTLLTDAEVGRWRTIGDVRRSFSAAVLYLRRQLLADEDPDEDEDSRYGDLVLTSAAFRDAVSVSLSVLVRSAGDVRRDPTGVSGETSTFSI